MKVKSIPYMGSKQEIAEKLFEFISPSRGVFIDAFGGGGAMSLAAKYRGFDKVIYNDKSTIVSKFFEDTIHRREPYQKWVSREEYEKLKYKDAYVGIIYGFKNNMKNSYLYSRDLEVFAKAAHEVLVYNSWELWELLGLCNIESPSPTKLEKEISRVCGKDFKLCHYSYLKRLNAVPIVDQGIEVCSMDYKALPVEDPNSVLYLDPPYANTRGYSKESFDSKELYEWASSLKIPVYLSEYAELKLGNLKEICRIQKNSMFSGSKQIKTERLYWNQI